MMTVTKIKIDEQTLLCQVGEPLLDALLRENIDVSHGCRQGACQSCMLRSLKGKPPAEAQHGLKDGLKQQNYFLACLCYPEQDMEIAYTHHRDYVTHATVKAKQMLNPEIMQLVIETDEELDYYAGQFVNLKRDDGLTRSYSISNHRMHGRQLSFHVRRLMGGQFSEWAHQELQIGDRLAVSEPQGLCYYQSGQPQQNLLLIGTGSGLAPLAGIISEALHDGHRGEIHLYHGSSDMNGLYWSEEMRSLQQRYQNFHYTPCISRGEPPAGIAKGRAHEIAFKDCSALKGWRVFLCGHPDMVSSSKRQAFLAGASMADIYADAFHVASSSVD
ncbi:2Fe-2S iron-sulfur cluster-binding protein [Methylomarinum sp. Ch1-1]|uniref:2Fe-2S iron-sulfur cluster-binding protein n=1 Tax=Methylomarinum roseum TaxID=3067653 RepID=A0AAU7NZG0_9GAMM